MLLRTVTAAIDFPFAPCRRPLFLAHRPARPPLAGKNAHAAGAGGTCSSEPPLPQSTPRLRRAGARSSLPIGLRGHRSPSARDASGRDRAGTTHGGAPRRPRRASRRAGSSLPHRASAARCPRPPAKRPLRPMGGACNPKTLSFPCLRQDRRSPARSDGLRNPVAPGNAVAVARAAPWGPGSASPSRGAGSAEGEAGLGSTSPPLPGGAITPEVAGTERPNRGGETPARRAQRGGNGVGPHRESACSVATVGVASAASAAPGGQGQKGERAALESPSLTQQHDPRPSPQSHAPRSPLR